MALVKSQGRPVLRYAASFANTDKSRLFAGDAVRLVHAGRWDLEPFGRLRFRFEGQGSGHVVSLRAVAGTPSQMNIMYALAGERRLTEFELDWLPGYENSRPVRVGIHRQSLR